MSHLPDRQTILARLHLHAVLPALEDLAALSPETRQLAAGWKFSLRLALLNGPSATLSSPGDGRLVVTPGDTAPARLVLRFLTASQLNRTFLNQGAFPPLPTGGFWRVLGVRTFIKLTKQLDRVLQATPDALANEPFRLLHLRLLFRVLVGAVPIVAETDGVSRHTLSHTPPGTVELRVPGLRLVGHLRWAKGRMTSALGPAPDARPDAVITFVDLPTADDALLGRLDPNAAVGLGRVDVRGLIPLADGLSVVMDRVEGYIKPPGAPAVPALAFSGAAA